MYAYLSTLPTAIASFSLNSKHKGLSGLQSHTACLTQSYLARPTYVPTTYMCMLEQIELTWLWLGWVGSEMVLVKHYYHVFSWNVPKHLTHFTPGSLSLFGGLVDALDDLVHNVQVPVVGGRGSGL